MTIYERLTARDCDIFSWFLSTESVRQLQRGSAKAFREIELRNMKLVCLLFHGLMSDLFCCWNGLRLSFSRRALREVSGLYGSLHLRLLNCYPAFRFFNQLANWAHVYIQKILVEGNTVILIIPDRCLREYSEYDYRLAWSGFQNSHLVNSHLMKSSHSI